MHSTTQQHQPPTEAVHTGSCLCGGIRFSIRGELAPIQICHCSQCRRAQGGPVATNIPVAADQVTWLSGEDRLKKFESSAGKWRAFCADCGSPLFSQRANLPGVLRIRAGLLDEPTGAVLGFHQQVASRAPWWPQHADGLPQYAGAAELPQKLDNH